MQHRLRRKVSAAADPSGRDSAVLPEPDPRGEVVGRGKGQPTTPSAMSSTGASRSSTISGKVASRRSTAYATIEGEERAFKLFESAAGYEAVRREIGALRKIRHPHVVEVFLGWQDRRPVTGT